MNLHSKTFAFADDIVVICIGDLALNRVINIVNEWSNENDIRVNTKKVQS